MTEFPRTLYTYDKGGIGVGIKMNKSSSGRNIITIDLVIQNIDNWLQGGRKIMNPL